MANNIAVSITADVADLTQKLAVARAQMSVTTASLRDLAKEAQANGLTDELKTKLLAAGNEAAHASNTFNLFKKELQSFGPAVEGAAHGSAGVTRELIVMGRELARGNFSRMAGSATILAGRLGVLTPTVIGVAAAVAAIAAPFAIFIAASEAGASELGKFQGAMEATNGYAGVTISQLQNMSNSMSQWAHEGIGTAMKELYGLAASGKFTNQTLLLVGEDATKMAQLTGESADKFNQQFEKMSDGVAKFAQDYQDHYHQLTTAQYEYIRQLEEQGNKEQAEYQLAKDVYDYLGNQVPQNLGTLERAWHGVANAISSAWENLKAYGRDSNQDQLDQINDKLTALKAPNHNLSDDSDPGTDAATIASLEKQKQLIEGREAAEQKSSIARAASANTQTEGVDAAAKLKDKFDDSRTSGEKLRIKLGEINDELAKSVAADPGGKAKYENEAAAARAQAEKSDAPKGPKKAKAGPDVVSEWTQQLRQQEVASGEFFKDQTADELKFWQAKLALVASGSKDWLSIQGKIYEGQKALAHQAYDAELANLNSKLAADHDSWTKEQADWQAKLAFIKVKFGEMSAEYENAAREQETAEGRHQDEVMKAQENGLRQQEESLKRRLDTARQIRADDARTTEELLKRNGEATPFGDVGAAVKIGALHHQLIEQEMADNATLQAAKSAQLDKTLSDAESKYTQDSQQYINAVNAKKQADEEYAAQQQLLSARVRAQQIQDVLAVQAAYSGYIQGTVNATVTGFSKMLGGQQTWAQTGIGIYNSLVQQVEQQIEKMVTKWVIEHVFMTSAQRAQLAVQTVAHGASEAAKTVSTVAGAASRTAAQTTANVAAATAQKALAVQQVATLVGLAGAGGVASMAAAPFPLDLGAPAFGASMAAAAAGFGSVAGFAQGTNLVPSDMIAQIHAGERIIPAADNRDLMAAVGARGSGGGGGGVANDNRRGGDTHVHYSPTVNGQMPFADQLAEHEDNIIGMLQNARRRGAFK